MEMGAKDVGDVSAARGERTAGSDTVGALTDEELLSGTRRLVCQSNQTLAALLAHLAEVEARGLHRTRACASLFIYCIYELRMSEDAAYRRVAAARLVKRFPLVFGAIERGELHLTALLLLGPHLTEANVVEVLARAKFRTKKEVLKLVRLLSPLPDVPSRIEPLGLERRPAPRATWANLMAAQCPVRHLEPDARPTNWLPDEAEGDDARAAVTGAAMLVDSAALETTPTTPARSDSTSLQGIVDPLHALARTDATPSQLIEAPPHAPARRESAAELSSRWAVPAQAMSEQNDSASWQVIAAPMHALARNDSVTERLERTTDAPARVETTAASLDGPQRFKVQFTASEEYVALVEEATALLAHALPRANLAEVHLRAMRALVAGLKKRKYATARGGGELRAAPSSRDLVEAPLSAAPAHAAPSARRQLLEPEGESSSSARRELLESRSESCAVPPESTDPTCNGQPQEPTLLPRQRDRHVPAAVRRAVFERDGNRCAFVDSRGERCRETSRLEFHHHEPFARGGPTTPENLSLYCAAHNTLAAERDFGRELARARRDEPPHFTERTTSQVNAPQ